MKTVVQHWVKIPSLISIFTIFKTVGIFCGVEIRVRQFHLQKIVEVPENKQNIENCMQKKFVKSKKYSQKPGGE